MEINYNASVYIPGVGGWRAVCITASAERISAKRARVIDVLAINREAVAKRMSRTSSKRQSFHGEGIAARESGKIKNLSATF